MMIVTLVNIYIHVDILQLLLLVGAKLEYIIVRLAEALKDEEAANVVGMMRKRREEDAIRVKPSDEYFWFNSPALLLDLIHFILFQNSFEIAFFFWIWVSMFMISSISNLRHICWIWYCQNKF